MATQVRTNYHTDCETHINQHITLSLSASNIFLYMANHYGKDAITLPGLAKLMNELSHEEHETAQKLMEYQNVRGGLVVMKDLPRPADHCSTALEGLTTALTMQKSINQSFLEMHKKSSGHNDAHLCNYIEDNFLNDKVEIISKLAHYITQLKRAGPSGLGEYIFDKHLQ